MISLFSLWLKFARATADVQVFIQKSPPHCRGRRGSRYLRIPRSMSFPSVHCLHETCYLDSPSLKHFTYPIIRTSNTVSYHDCCKLTSSMFVLLGVPFQWRWQMERERSLDVAGLAGVFSNNDNAAIEGNNTVWEACDFAASSGSTGSVGFNVKSTDCCTIVWEIGALGFPSCWHCHFEKANGFVQVFFAQTALVKPIRRPSTTGPSWA